MVKRTVRWVGMAALLGLSGIGCGEMPPAAEDEGEPATASFAAATCVSGMGACGADTGYSLWGIKAYSNGAKNGTASGCTTGGTGKRYMCTDYVERFFDRMGSAFQVDFTYTGNECESYDADANFGVSYDAGTSVKQGDAIVWRDSGGGHTAIVVSESSGVIKFIQQNVTCGSTSVIAPRDTVTRVNGKIPSYGHPFKCRIRATGACPTVGAWDYDSTGCWARECLSTHVYSSWQSICHGK